MKKTTIVITLVAALLAGCAGGSGGASSSSTNTGTVTVTLLHYNDLHAHLTPHVDRVATAAGGTQLVERGGIARLATLVNQIRAQNPNTVLMNIGDTYHGGVEALFTAGNAIADPVNALGIDVGVPGNWDFAYGPNVTRLRYASLTAPERQALLLATQTTMGLSEVKGPSFPNLAANVTFTMPLNKAGQPFLPPTWTTTRGGVKLGFIGLSSDIVPEMSATLATGLAFVTGESNYKALVEQHAAGLRAQGAQLVFVLSELGLHKNKRLADVLAPGTIDVLFSAHTHEAVTTPIISASGTRVVETGNDGNLGRMDITVTPGAPATFAWTLLPIDRNIAEDTVMKSLVNAARAPFLVADPNIKLPMPYVDLTLHQSINTVMGYTDGPLDRRQALDNTFNRVFTDALRARTGTQLAMTPGFRFDAIASNGELFEDNTVTNGAITLEDVYRFFPVVYTIAIGETTGAHLKQVLETGLTHVYSKDAFAQGGGWTEGFSGLGASINVAGNDGARVQSLWLANTLAAIDDNATYTITGCRRPDDTADVLCSYTGFSNVQDYINPATASAWTVNELFVDLLRTGAFSAAPAARFTDTSNTPVWPSAPYVQPLW